MSGFLLSVNRLPLLAAAKLPGKGAPYSQQSILLCDD